uniref:Uncharacterized protein n=1 Tax=Candidatus Kentrum sp. TC TaxID=2126339 RepID=A0A451A2P9_9GAMM|nr:MAG: hypothetical protein BECKTC1821F_GA0114240_104413 [Candidatus Kentron sp. TC]
MLKMNTKMFLIVVKLRRYGLHPPRYSSIDIVFRC